MDCFANGSAVSLWYCEEDVNGAISATVPVFKPIRFVSNGFNREASQIDSDEINENRQRPVSRQGTYSTAGTVEGELSFASHDDLIAAAMQSEWVDSVSRAATTISAANADDSFNDSANGFITAGYAVGDIINVSGFTGAGVVVNNVQWKIATVAAGKITVTNVNGTPATTLVDDAAGEMVTISSQRDILKIGSTRRSFAVLERHTDRALDYIYRGCEVGAMAFAFPLGDKVTVNFTLMGRQAEAYVVPGGATFTAKNTNEMMVTTEGFLKEAGVTIAYATEVNINLDNGMEAQFALFSRAAYCISNGTAVVDGDLSFYLKDATMYGKYLGETLTSLILQATDGVNTYTFYLPKLRYVTGSKETNGPGAIIPQLNFSAGFDSVMNTTFAIERS